MSSTAARALVFVNGRNCARYVAAALESLAWQTHDAVHVLFVDDCSDDATANIARQFLQDHFADRHTLVRNPQPWGKARNAHVHLRAALGHGDFVAVLDADDQLIRATALAEMAAEYRAGFDVVWTNYETDLGHPGHCSALDPLKSPRGQGWRTSHFFSFRSELLEAVGEAYFQDEFGAWLTAACDRAIALPVLDQTRRYRFLPVRAYRYTTTNPASHHNQDPASVNFSSRRQSACAELIDAKPPLPCTRWLFGTHGAADQAVGEMLQQLVAAKASTRAQALAQAAPQPAAQLPAQPPAQAHASASPQPNADADAGLADAAAWASTAASALHGSCPALLALATDGLDPLPPATQLWRWWQWLQSGPAQPRVLAVGAGALAPALDAMVAALGGTLLAIDADAQRAAALRLRLARAGLPAEVAHIPLAHAEFDGSTGRFPEVAALPDDANGFDLVVVCADTCAAAPTDARLSLPLLVPRLKPEGFRLCVWSPADPQPLRAAYDAWRRVAPDLAYSDHEFAGRALVVQ